MPQDLRELYKSFDAYLVRLNADLGQAIAHLPEPKQKGLLAKRLDFVEFCDFWQRVANDPIEVYRWMRRLRPGGYEEEQEAIRRGFSWNSGDRAARPREPAPPQERAA